MKRSSLLLAVAAYLLITGCSTNSVGLVYKPAVTPAAVGADSGTVSVRPFVDQRGEPAAWIGAIRGGFGNPLKTVEVSPSVAVVVETAFIDGVKARSLQPPSGSANFQISGVITKLDCSQYVRREAHVAIEVRVVDAISEKPVFTQTYTADELDGSLIALNVGVFGSVESLRALAEKALNEVVDKALDDPALRSAIKKHP